MILQLTPAGTELVAVADSASEHWLCGQLALLTEGERASLAEAIPIMNRIANSWYSPSRGRIAHSRVGR